MSFLLAAKASAFMWVLIYLMWEPLLDANLFDEDSLGHFQHGLAVAAFISILLA